MVTKIVSQLSEQYLGGPWRALALCPLGRRHRAACISGGQGGVGAGQWAQAISFHLPDKWKTPEGVEHLRPGTE